MKKINVNAVVYCKAAHCRAQVIGNYCKKIYRSFSGSYVITEWHRLPHYESIIFLDAPELIVLDSAPAEINESTWN